MFYQLIKITVRLALKIFCREICINRPGLLKTVGPFLITANHPNSFLDAVIIGSVFKRPVHYLARGDAFTRPWHSKLLRLLNMIPVYRLSEGKENLALNEGAFSRSKEILAQNGIVLIFIEGVSKQTHELQPFKKGAARIALESKGLKNFRVVPLGIAYHSFDRFGKLVNINIGEPVGAQTLLFFEEEAKNMRQFNSNMHEKIERLVIRPNSRKNKNNALWPFLCLPAMAGFILHIPLYTFLKKAIRKKTAGTVFFDSVLFGSLLILYPLYLMLAAIFFCLMQMPALLLFCILLAHPLTAWCAVWWKAETVFNKGHS